MADAIRTMARTASADHAVSLKLAGTLGEGNCLENMNVATCPCLPAVVGDVIYADIDEDNLVPLSLPVRDLLRLEIEPFVVGCGWVIVDDVANGIVVRLRDAGKEHFSHDVLRS